MGLGYFYCDATVRLESIYPKRAVSITSSDLAFMTPEIKTILRRKNYLMRRGRIEGASACAQRVGRAIAQLTTDSYEISTHALEWQSSGAEWPTSRVGGIRIKDKQTISTSRPMNPTHTTCQSPLIHLILLQRKN